jgi:hypothetical protein
MKLWPMSLALATLPVAVVVAVAAQSPADARPASTVRQLMQSVLFPNANVVFAVQREDPEAVTRDGRPSLATDARSGLYGGWLAVENSALALAESADLLDVRGRTCANGRAAPVQEADWRAGVQALRTAALEVATASRRRSADEMSDVIDRLTESCSGCHQRYRTRDTPCVLSR